MEFIIRCKRCEQCRDRFKNGDRMYRISYDSRTLCGDCVTDMPNEEFVSHNGFGYRVFQKPLPRGLGYGIYILEEQYGVVTIREAVSRPEFEKNTYLECQEGKVTMWLAESQRGNWMQVNETIENAPEYGSISVFGTHIIMDENGVAYGFSNSPKIDSSVAPEKMIQQKKIQSVSMSDLQKEYDLSNFAKKVRYSLRNLTPKALMDYCEKRVQGQELELRKAVYLIWQYLKAVLKGKHFQAFNWFLTAPSGCGKTEFYRTIRQYFLDHDVPIPVVQIDLSRVTEEGFRGLDPSNIIDMIKHEQSDTNGYAICFLDETDKKLIPNFDGHGDNVNKNVQGALLTLIEGIASDVDKDGFSKDYDSSLTMFVFMGAFQDLRIERQQNAARAHRVGFNAGDEEKRSSTDSFYAPVTMEDIIHFGMQEELAGRIQQVINFKRMSDESMLRLLRCKTEQIGEELGFRIELTEQAEQELLSISFGNLGLRHPLNKIRELALNTVSADFFNDDFQNEIAAVRIESLENAVLVQPEIKEMQVHRKKKYGIRNGLN